MRELVVCFALTVTILFWLRDADSRYTTAPFRVMYPFSSDLLEFYCACKAASITCRYFDPDSGILSHAIALFMNVTNFSNPFLFMLTSSTFSDLLVATLLIMMLILVYSLCVGRLALISI